MEVVSQIGKPMMTRIGTRVEMKAKGQIEREMTKEGMSMQSKTFLIDLDPIGLMGGGTEVGKLKSASCTWTGVSWSE